MLALEGDAAVALQIAVAVIAAAGRADIDDLDLREECPATHTRHPFSRFPDAETMLLLLKLHLYHHAEFS